jgi:phosphohistidine phosphatase
MKIFVMRHGDAHLSADSDMQRPLSPIGESEAAHATDWLCEHYFAEEQNIDYAMVSPYLRTKQTFAKVTEKFNVTRTEYTRDIIPSASASVAQDYLDTVLAAHPEIENVLLVTHMPFVSYFVEALTKSTPPLFATASIAVIDYQKSNSHGHILEHKQAYFS